jgi:secernin
MCDTFVVLSDSTVNNHVIFGKNSDRPQGEIQDVVVMPSQTYSENESLQCTYLAIPQVEKTLAVILSKPRWMWGAEMGANECGVVIGNEAVWTIEPYENNGLLGMDLVRLGLERGKTAKEALDIIIQLLTEYGQGGNCAEQVGMNYHNSFLMADANEAYLLETAGKYWVVEPIKTGTRSISNSLSIQKPGNFHHPEVMEHAMTMGLCKNKSDFHFAKMFSEGGIESPPPTYTREGRVRELCELHQGQFSIETAKFILRDHQSSVCMHGDFETTGSQISSLSKDGCEHWFINKPLPCQQEYSRYDFE